MTPTHADLIKEGMARAAEQGRWAGRPKKVRAVSPEPAAQEPLAEGIHGCPTIVVASPDAPGLATDSPEATEDTPLSTDHGSPPTAGYSLNLPAYETSARCQVPGARSGRW